MITAGCFMDKPKRPLTSRPSDSPQAPEHPLYLQKRRLKLATPFTIMSKQHNRCTIPDLSSTQPTLVATSERSTTMIFQPAAAHPSTMMDPGFTPLPSLRSDLKPPTPLWVGQSPSTMMGVLENPRLCNDYDKFLCYALLYTSHGCGVHYFRSFLRGFILFGMQFIID